MLPLADPDAILKRVVCPRCRHRLHDVCGREALVCDSCAARYPQRSARWIDLRVTLEPEPSEGRRWEQCQREMTAAYDELIADPAHARLAYRNDLQPLRRLLSSLTGAVLDIGGGNGLLRHVLAPDVDYVALDPESSWLTEQWLAIADEYGCLRRPLAFVGGFAEAIPFPDDCFDAVTSIWSLNHCGSPPTAIAEIRRVLRPGGRFLLVLDDVAPRWHDVFGGHYVDGRFPTRGALVVAKLTSMIRGWPLQPDHVRISERDVIRWTRGCSRAGRGFSGSYFWTSLVNAAD
jgi:SAM-dependent methyltransferase